MQPINIRQFGVICALGADKAAVQQGFEQGNQNNLQPFQLMGSEQSVIVAQVPDSWLTDDPNITRNNKLVLAALEQVQPAILDVIETHGADRVGIVMGTSTSGISHGEQAVCHKQAHGSFPSDFCYAHQEMGDPAQFVKHKFGILGPSYCISTACSSSGKAFASAQAMIEAGLVDAVICGGADSLCQLTTQGFSALEAVSTNKSNPFSINRDGINIGEGAALFVLEKAEVPKGLFVAGCGESSDAYHISAPEPEGKGAIVAMKKALEQAGINAGDIDYINAHGTGTKHNDSMESKAIAEVLGPHVPCSSTKPLTGHTLGAAGAIEAALCCLLLQQQLPIPAMLWDGEIDSELAQINLVSQPTQLDAMRYLMSNSFAFGGSNVSVILGYNSSQDS